MTKIPVGYQWAFSFTLQSDGAWLAEPSVEWADYGNHAFAARSLLNLKRSLRSDVSGSVRYEIVAAESSGKPCFIRAYVRDDN